MRPFIAWPRWAVELLRKVLARTGMMPGTLFRLDVECWERDVRDFEDDNSIPSYRCVPPGGVH